MKTFSLFRLVFGRDLLLTIFAALALTLFTFLSAPSANAANDDYLTVTLSESTPGGRVIPAFSNNQVFVVADITNNNSYPVEIYQVNISHLDSGDLGEINSLEIFVDSRQYGSVSSGIMAILNMESDPIVLAPHDSVPLTIAADIGEEINGESHRIGIANASDIRARRSDTKAAVNITGTFPVLGERMTIDSNGSSDADKMQVNIFGITKSYDVGIEQNDRIGILYIKNQTNSPIIIRDITLDMASNNSFNPTRVFIAEGMGPVSDSKYFSDTPSANEIFTLSTNNHTISPNAEFAVPIYISLDVESRGSASFELVDVHALNTDGSNYVIEDIDHTINQGNAIYSFIGVSKKPDLVVDDIWIKNTGTGFHPAVRFCNKGGKAVHVRDMNILLKHDAWTMSEQLTVDMAPGNCTEITMTSPATNLGIRETGSYTVGAYVDSTNIVSESDEENNRMEKKVYANLSLDVEPAKITRLSLDPNSDGYVSDNTIKQEEIFTVRWGSSNTDFCLPYGNYFSLPDGRTWYDLGPLPTNGSLDLITHSSGTVELGLQCVKEDGNSEDESAQQLLRLDVIDESVEPISSPLSIPNNTFEYIHNNLNDNYAFRYCDYEVSSCEIYYVKQEYLPEAADLEYGESIQLFGTTTGAGVALGTSYYNVQAGVEMRRLYDSNAINIPQKTFELIDSSSGDTYFLYSCDSAFDFCEVYQAKKSYFSDVEIKTGDKVLLSGRAKKIGVANDTVYYEVQEGVQLIFLGDNSTPPPAGYEDEVLTTYDIYANPFPDTNIATLAGKAAAELYRRAVIGGFPDGEFKGYRPVSRAGAAKFLLLSRYGTIDESITNNGRFPDVLEGEWYVPYVVRANELGIINGYGNGNFGPGDNVKVGQFLKMLSKTFNIPVTAYEGKSPWFTDYLSLVDQYDLFPGKTSATIDGYHVMSRDEVATAIYQYLKNR